MCYHDPMTQSGFTHGSGEGNIAESWCSCTYRKETFDFRNVCLLLKKSFMYETLQWNTLSHLNQAILSAPMWWGVLEKNKQQQQKNLSGKVHIGDYEMRHSRHFFYLGCSPQFCSKGPGPASSNFHILDFYDILLRFPPHYRYIFSFLWHNFCTATFEIHDPKEDLGGYLCW